MLCLRKKTLFQTNNTVDIHNASSSEEGIVTNNRYRLRGMSTSQKNETTVNRSCFRKVNTNEERVVTAVELAYVEYTEFLEGIMKNLRLGEIIKAENKIVVHEGILFEINFEIDYVPAGVKMECVTSVLEDLAKVFDVKNVSCDCCVEKDASKIPNVINHNIPK